MRKINLFLFATIALAFLANFTSVQASPALKDGYVGLVVAYTPDQNITIVDKDGNQFSFTLETNPKIVPEHRAALLAPGVYVTIVASDDGVVKQIVIHPQAPAGFPLTTATPTAIPTNTVENTATLVPGETPTEVFTATPTAAEGPTATAVFTQTATPTSPDAVNESLPTQANPRAVMARFVNWLASLFG
jgi:hypothetical protein